MTKEELLIDYLLSIEEKRGKKKDKSKIEKFIREEMEAGVYDDTLNLMQKWADYSSKPSEPVDCVISFPSFAEMRTYSQTTPDYKQKLNSSQQVIWRLGALWMRAEVTERNKKRK